MEVLEEIKSLLGDEEDHETNLIVPFSLLTKDAVESLRYRAEVILFWFLLVSDVLFNYYG